MQSGRLCEANANLRTCNAIVRAPSLFVIRIAVSFEPANHLMQANSRSSSCLIILPWCPSLYKMEEMALQSEPRYF